MAHAMYPGYVDDVFGYQEEIMLKNLEIYKQAVGDRIQVIWVSGTDLGTQKSTFTSLDTFRKLYKAADTALYESKKAGKKRATYSGEFKKH